MSDQPFLFHVCFLSCVYGGGGYTFKLLVLMAWLLIYMWNHEHAIYVFLVAVFFLRCLTSHCTRVNFYEITTLSVFSWFLFFLFTLKPLIPLEFTRALAISLAFQSTADCCNLQFTAQRNCHPFSVFISHSNSFLCELSIRALVRSSNECFVAENNKIKGGPLLSPYCMLRPC